MRAELADRRDTTWEDLGPRFRVFVYPGDAKDTRIIDIVDVSIDTVFREMRIFSDDDRHLWSVALVRGEGAQRGLVWLSGYDYDDTPTDGVEWQRRREMQDRYLMARSRRGEPLVLPDGRRVIRMFSGWASSPLWESFTDEYVVDPRSLGISDDLTRDLLAWDGAIQDAGPDGPVPADSFETGLAIWRRLRDELAPIAEVRPDFWATGQVLG
ncbi:hypothetical protein A9Z40_03825 [Microbacterium arborescens]|uniref:Uncharacterized protein n=2 Tax=Microbacterium TaxID=33882 RepID=A0ABU1I4T8_9MICO|nr:MULTISPECIES: hypothetical protein [Microbacterium]APF34062.1 hypothetical protein BO218_07565 [Microbacterium paludicola]MDR6168646.1 hypothetical protein [Microbacterium paludicola]OAZ41074.1 hypothetical protein A9Z40_03825 [Microbacterium arborescens]QCR39563.1 hypothetical protein C1N74_03390 [Microbacterium sp. SGAir0570]